MDEKMMMTIAEDLTRARGRRNPLLFHRGGGRRDGRTVRWSGGQSNIQTNGWIDKRIAGFTKENEGTVSLGVMTIFGPKIICGDFV